MKKVEFPTFLNEKPSVIFGRTGRELLVIACGAGLGYNFWSNIKLAGDPTSLIIHIVLTALPVLLAFCIAVISIAGRPIEEWIFVLLLYLFIPKIYQYVPFDPEEQAPKKTLPYRQRLLHRWINTNDEEEDK